MFKKKKEEITAKETSIIFNHINKYTTDFIDYTPRTAWY